MGVPRAGAEMGHQCVGGCGKGGRTVGRVRGAGNRMAETAPFCRSIHTHGWLAHSIPLHDEVSGH